MIASEAPASFCWKGMVVIRGRNGNGRAEKVITVKLDTEDHDRQVRMESHMEQHNLSSEKILAALHRIEVKQGP